MNIHKVIDWKDKFKDSPLIIVGPGPSFDSAPEPFFDLAPVFCLNHTITHFFQRPDHWWVSNDHDRTFQNLSLKIEIQNRLQAYACWRTITNRKFIPGEFGDIDWIDHRGNPQKPTSWRMPCPEESSIWWYHENEGFDGHVRNGQSVLELALEVATIWNFSPIILVGIDLELINRGSGKEPIYYAKPWRWKETPRRVLKGHKLSDIKISIEKNRERWTDEIYHTSEYATRLPFEHVTFKQAEDIIKCEEWKES